MANRQWTHVNQASTDPTFRAWAKNISDTLGGDGGSIPGIGLVRQSASSIASAWGTVIPNYSTLVSNLNSEIAWEIYAFPPSSQQTAAPLFVRVGYGIGSSSGSPALTFKFSTSAGPGGGVTTGIGGSGLLAANPGSGTNATASTCWASCDNHGFAIVFGIDHPSQGTYRSMVAVDRFRSPNGVAQTTGFAMYRTNFGAGTVTAHQFDLVADELQTVTSFAPCVTQTGLSTTSPNLTGDSKVQVYPWHSVTKNAHGVSKMVCTHAQPDIVSLGTQQVQWLPATGSPATRTVRSLGSFMTGVPFDIQNLSTSGACAAIWWSDP